MNGPDHPDPLAPRPSDPPPEPTPEPPPEPTPGGDVADPDAPIVERRARPERRGADRRKKSVPVPVERRTGEDRRSQADRRDQGKRGGEYDLDEDTLEFIAAVNRFKQASGKQFPTWSELLAIVKDLGYVKM